MTAIDSTLGPGATGISVSGTQLTLGSQAGSADSPDERKLKKAAGDFESILLASMWKSMKDTFGKSDLEGDSDPAHGTLEDWGIELMSSAVGKAGGLGIGKLILKHLAPHDHSGTQDSSEPAHSPKVLGNSADKAKEEAR